MLDIILNLCLYESMNILLRKSNEVMKERPRMFSLTRQSDKTCVSVLPLRIVFGCLLPDTSIETEHGLKPIKDIVIGDKIRHYSSKWVTVANTWRGRERGEIVEITADGKTLKATKTHPVLSEARASGTNHSNGIRYVRADSLKAGDIVVVANNKVAVVEKVTFSEYEGEVCNLDTADNSPFLADGITVGTNREQNDLIDG
jgi:intein/homing endonuclease